MHLSPGPPKLSDCRRPCDDAELFLVEGDSASASVAVVRDVTFQAVLPMQGKPLNPLRATAQRVGANPWYAALIAALGAGWGTQFNLQRLRYGKVLLLMDPDADGIHCGLLLQMFFHRWMRPLVDDGRLHAVWAPMAEIHVAGQLAPVFAYTEPQLRSLREEVRTRGARIIDTEYYRGLGSIPSDRLAANCVRPATRTTIQILSADVIAAIKLFGGNSSPAASAQMDLFGAD